MLYGIYINCCVIFYSPEVKDVSFRTVLLTNATWRRSGFLWFWYRFITALYGMQTRSSDENSVRPSIRSSVHMSNSWIV